MTILLVPNSAPMPAQRRKPKDGEHVGVSEVAFRATTPRAKNMMTEQADPTSMQPGELSLNAIDSDAHSALMKLRELVVGPSQQLNEARLEELIKLCEEREEQLQAALRDMQLRNSDLEFELRKVLSENSNSLRSEILDINESLLEQSKKTTAGLHDEMGALRKETNVLSQSVKDMSAQRIEATEARFNASLTKKFDHLQSEMIQLRDMLTANIDNERRASHVAIGRLLQEAGETLARESGVKSHSAR